MDEPASALDPIATLAIEDLIARAQEGLHDRDRDPQHAAGARARATSPRSSTSRRAASPADLVEIDDDREDLLQPVEQATEDYVTGRFG